MRNKILLAIVGLALSACSGSGVKKIVIDATPDRPAWVDKNALSWEEDGKIYFKAQQTVRGDQRVNGCFVVASHDAREAMLRGIAEEMKGATQEAQTDLSEQAELILGKVRSGEWQGKLYGFTDTERFFERYQLRDMATGQATERIDCATLAYVSKADFNRTKQEVLNRIVAVDPRVKEAIVKKQVDFFQDRGPASTKEGQE